MDLETEKQEVTIYRSNNSENVSMDINDLVDLAVRGFQPCKKDSLATGAFCPSRKYSGDDACSCIRAVFPNPDYYELYELLREYYLRNVGKALLVKIAGDLVEKNN